jgi:hypothetical protein
MTDKKISELTSITGAVLSDTDLIPVVDVSVSETKKITFAEFKNALDTSTGFVRLTGDTMTGTLVAPSVTVTGNSTLGNATTDTVTITAEVASNLNPSADNLYDLGAVGGEWRNLYVTGTANIDSLVADTVDINEGTIDSVVIGSASAAAGAFTTLSASSTVSGTGFSTYLASPPAIGSTTAAAITGTTITGTSFVSSGNMSFGDDDKALFGTSDDLSIYHSGADSFIWHTGTGDLLIAADDLTFVNGANSELKAKFVTDGASQLYHDGALKFATSATGADVTGTLSASTGAFTALSASGTVSGTGFSTYLASPPAIGSTAAAAGNFSSLTMPASSTENKAITVGLGRAGSGNSSVDLIGDAAYPVYGTRLIRSGGATTISHRGTSTMTIETVDAAVLSLDTTGTPRISIGATGVVTISNLAGSGSRAVNASATGVLSAASDSRLKQEVPTAPIPGLAEVMQLEPRAYKWLDDIENRGDNAAVEIGFFADEVKSIIPSAAPMGNDGYYGFYDRAVTTALTKAIQEQQAVIVALEARIAALEAKF